MRKRGERIKEERLEFKEGLQKEFLEQNKRASGLTWKELADVVNVSEYTVRYDWRNEHSTIPLSCAKAILACSGFKSWREIERNWLNKVLPKNWGQKLVGELNKKRIRVPQKSEELAELFGAILGDGHLERKILSITGNCEEKAHHDYLSAQIEKLFGLKSVERKMKQSKAIQLMVNSTELIRFLLENSFVLGNKIKNKESLPRWIFEKDEYACGALRGLLDTDGGIYQKQKNYKRAIIEFQTESPYIRADIYKMLRKLGFNPSKSDVNVRVQEQKEVRRFMSLVGCANPKNIMRYKYFIETGAIPLKEKIWAEIAGMQVDKPFKAAVV